MFRDITSPSSFVVRCKKRLVARQLLVCSSESVKAETSMNSTPLLLNLLEYMGFLDSLLVFYTTKV